MTTTPKPNIGRREVLRALGAGATAAIAAVPLPGEALADSETNYDKRKARYQPDSPHIQAYYRVIRYPQK